MTRDGPLSDAEHERLTDVLDEDETDAPRDAVDEDPLQAVREAVGNAFEGESVQDVKADARESMLELIRERHDLDASDDSE